MGAGGDVRSPSSFAIACLAGLTRSALRRLPVIN